MVVCKCREWLGLLARAPLSGWDAGRLGARWCRGAAPRHANRRLRLQALTRRDEEFVLSHCHNIQSSGFLEHIKLPHYVDFQAELELIRKLRCEAAQGLEAAQ